MKIDLGCGAYKSEGLLGVDILEHPNVDIQHDLNIFPWPFENDSVDYVQANHVLEHVANFIGSVEEIWRISKSGAIIEVRCPHASCFPTVWADPTHKRAMVKNSFIHWGGESKNIYGFKGEFAVEEVRLHYCLYQGERNGSLTTSMRMKKIGRLLDRLVNASPRMQNIFERFLCGYLGGFEEVYFKLRVVK
jgi:predicted SAM-dependent methyltransferase